MSCIETVTTSLSVLSHPSTVCEAYTIRPSVSTVVESNKFPPVSASYHWILPPVADKSATVEIAQKVCWASPVGGAGPLFIKLNDSVTKQVSVIASSTLIYIVVFGLLVEKFVRLLIIGFKSFSAS